MCRSEPWGNPEEASDDEEPAFGADPYQLFEHLQRMANLQDSSMKRWQRGGNPWGDSASDAWFARVRQCNSAYYDAGVLVPLQSASVTDFLFCH